MYVVVTFYHNCMHSVFQSGTPLQLVSEAVRSILAISDLFTEKAQFQWMLATCLELGKHHPLEDEILHQYLVFGACKAAAVLGPVSSFYAVLTFEKSAGPEFDDITEECQSQMMRNTTFFCLVLLGH